MDIRLFDFVVNVRYNLFLDIVPVENLEILAEGVLPDPTLVEEAEHRWVLQRFD
jgi:hypothetical protein